MTAVHAMPFGAELREDGTTRFRLWAPGAAQVGLEIDGASEALAMQPLAGGWHERVQPAPPGTRYRYRLPNGLSVPDPASRSNPDDVHAASAVVDPRAYAWQDAGWRGRAWEEAVVYELHVGTFTPEGTFLAAIARLDALAATGITAIELMPLAEFAGRRNWGYDGVLPFAPESAYGPPDALKALVDAAHARNLMVFLDVVYNHFGPEGNYLGAYAPQLFDPAEHTPWGAAINFADETVRALFVHNALYWTEEFRFDGLRLDAVHAIADRSPQHIVEEIGAALRVGPGRERQVHLIIENETNQVRLLTRDASGGPRAATAVWNDDVHHAFHVLLTGESDGYYADYADRPLERLGRALAEGFAYQGDRSAFRGGETRGEPSGGLPPTAFVNSLQTHDQVGNRAHGERIDALAEATNAPALLDAALACWLLAPQIPMLFMGEEWGARTPFLFFCDFGAELARAVTEGRRGEFARFAAFASPAARAAIADPNAAETFARSRLDWSERETPAARARLERVTRLLALRREHVVPRLAGAQSGQYAPQGGLLRVAWRLGDGARLHLLANFGAPRAAASPPGRRIHAQGIDHAAPTASALARGAVYWSLETP